ncbi:Serralysin precursor [Tritonibacter multivorans]|uniref:Serralysin n=1 Tax=Tritonibacter multivorans TaxID=928856 RepID=A0A0P1G676_9RHOB|nr:M10 family metallopeptidase C-terminal domain-containing protein [Tritonibacter multivorans]MDA7422637.1 M10 family metallopeptidase C-terminal domain-containing protein [Tritonibacter multivorans]CUH77135.1 Serralysin precursor [Tritonibacter multivorans]SFD51133.1 serralysin [Tritonibacter multivorans]
MPLLNAAVLYWPPHCRFVTTLEGAAMCEICGDRSHHLFVSAGTDNTPAPTTYSTLPTYTLDQIADYLSDGFWEDQDFRRHSYDVAPGGSLVVDLSTLTAQGQTTARQALDAWTAVTGIAFVEGRSGVDIRFDDSDPGAWAQATSVRGNTTLETHINIAADWYDRSPDYYLQTYIHEIGHALGLGHTGDYNGSASYATDAHFANDSWQLSIMSYFTQTQNTTTDASYVFLASPQLADILAVQNLYGTPTNVESGNTVYGDGDTTGRIGMDLGALAVTLFDSGGYDTINLASRSYNQTLDLRAEQISDINGYRGNFAIARGVVIEEALTGSGQDSVTGNAASNFIDTGAGQDHLAGGGGADTLVGGSGQDTLTGGSGGDVFRYHAVDEAGDRITDFSAAAGDQLDLAVLLTAIGYRPATSAATPFSDGTLLLEASAGGAWLVVTWNSQRHNLVFLSGLSATADLQDMVYVGDLPDPPNEPDPDPIPVPDPDPEPTPERDTIYTITDSFVTNWTPANSLIRDTDGGTDTLDLSAVTYDARISLINGTPSQIDLKTLTIGASADIENLNLGSGNDEGRGNDGNNDIRGNGGDDHLVGAAGDDVLTAGTGNDTLEGGAGQDSLNASSGFNRLDGGAGDDHIRTQDGVQTITAGAGDDTIRAAAGMQTIALDDGNNRLVVAGTYTLASGGDGDNWIFATGSHLSLTLGHGNNLIHTRSGGRGQIEESPESFGHGTLTLAAGDGANVVRTQMGHNHITLGDGGNTVSTGQGKDTVTSGDGADIIWGGAGADLLSAGGGDDELTGGAGQDILTGGRGADSFVFIAKQDAGDLITDFTLTEGDRLVLSGFLQAFGTTARDAIDNGRLYLEHRADGAGLWFDEFSDTGDRRLIAQLEGVSDATALTGDWIL